MKKLLILSVFVGFVGQSVASSDAQVSHVGDALGKVAVRSSTKDLALRHLNNVFNQAGVKEIAFKFGNECDGTAITHIYNPKTGLVRNDQNQEVAHALPLLDGMLLPWIIKNTSAMQGAYEVVSSVAKDNDVKNVTATNSKGTKASVDATTKTVTVQPSSSSNTSKKQVKSLAKKAVKKTSSLNKKAVSKKASKSSSKKVSKPATTKAAAAA